MHFRQADLDGDVRADALCRLTGQLSVPWPSPKLDLLTVCNELTRWPFTRHNRPDYPSLLFDLSGAIDAIGSSTGQLIGTEIYNLKTAARQNHPDPKQVVSFATVLKNRLERSDTCGALWFDLASQVATGPPPPLEGLFDSRNIFASVSEAVGHDTDWSGIGSVIQGVIREDRPHIEFARRAVGNPGSDARTVGKLSLPDRIDIVREFLSESGELADNVIWIGIDDAAMGTPLTRVAQIEFHRGVNLRAAIDRKELNKHIPDEVVRHPDKFTPRMTGPSDDLRNVVARVSLPNTPVATAIPTAVELIDAIFTHLGGDHYPGWNRSGSAVQFVNGEPIRTVFKREDHVGHDPNEWRYNPISGALYSLDPEAFNAHLTISPEYGRTLDYLRAYNAKEGRSAENYIAISVRMLENLRSAAESTSDWSEFATCHLRDRWAWQEVVRGICHAVEPIRVSDTASAWLKDDESAGELDRISRIINGTLYARGPVPVAELASNSAASLKLLDRTWLPARLVNHAIQVASQSPEKRAAAISRSCRSFDIQLNRLRRYRNLATHGGHLEPDGIRRIVGFATDLVTIAAHNHLRSVEESRLLPDLLEEQRLNAESKLNDTKSGNLPSVE